MASRALIVEDDDDLRRQISILLQDEGFEAEGVGSGEEAVDAIRRVPFDCVILDIGLPGMDGFDTCRALRAESGVPIIMLTARDDSFDVVAGLEAGADDYLTKPFVGKELAARIRALLRRARGVQVPPTTLVLGPIEVNPDAGTVLVDGEHVHLTRTEFRLLCELAARPGRVFSRETLLEVVWGYEYVGETKLVDVHVYRLRSKIERDPANPAHIVTVRGLGYKAVA